MRINSVHEEYTACTSEKSQFAREKRIVGRFESIMVHKLHRHEMAVPKMITLRESEYLTVQSEYLTVESEFYSQAGSLCPGVGTLY